MTGPAHDDPPDNPDAAAETETTAEPEATADPEATPRRMSRAPQAGPAGTRATPGRTGPGHGDRARPPRRQAPGAGRADSTGRHAESRRGARAQGAALDHRDRGAGGGAGSVAVFHPLMSVRNIVVVGLGAVTEQEVVDAVAVAPGTPLLQVDTDEVAGRIAEIRRVASVRVQREYPSTLRVTVVERVPVVIRDYPDGVPPVRQGRRGFRHRTAAAGRAVPRDREPGAAGPGDPGGAAGDDVAAARGGGAGGAGDGPVGRIDHVDAGRRPHRGVGTTDRTEEKALKLAALLTQPGQVYDVSSPDLPTVK